MSEDMTYDLGLVLEHGPEVYAGTGLDVRTVAAGIPGETKEHLRFDRVPWSRFFHAHGADDAVPRDLAELRSGGAADGEKALDALWEKVCREGMTYAPGALAVPFLLRIAAAPSAGDPAGVLHLTAEAARRERFGDGTRSGLLRIGDEETVYDTFGYPVNWSVEAARDAIAADARILLPLLDAPAPEVRTASCYALAAASYGSERISSALLERFGSEEAPEVRASLVLAVAQLARESGDTKRAAGMRAL